MRVGRPQRQLAEEPGDHRDVLGIDRTLSHRGGHQFPHRTQRLARDGRARAQIIRVADPAAGFLAADAVPHMRDFGPVFGPNLFGGGLGLGGGQDLVIDRLSRAPQGFAARQ